MNRNTIQQARVEAQLFLEQSDAVLSELDASRFSFVVGTRVTGQLRRTSMNLTRALADMRRPS